MPMTPTDKADTFLWWRAYGTSRRAANADKIIEQDIAEIEGRVHKTVCPTFTVTDKGPQQRLEGRINEADLKALVHYARIGVEALRELVKADETIAALSPATNTADSGHAPKADGATSNPVSQESTK